MNKLIAKVTTNAFQGRHDMNKSGHVSGGATQPSPLMMKCYGFVALVVDLLKHISFKGVVVTSMLLLIIVLSAVGVVYSSHLSRQLFAEQAILLEKNDQLQLEWAQLLLEQSAWSSPGRIEEVAREDLGMKIPETEEINLIY